jgi:outer membrane protein assembly factor BamA/autotransporter translocation and assembly factor TamB
MRRSTEADSPGFPMRRRLFRLLLGAGAALLVLAALLHSPPARQLVRARLEALLAERAGIAAHIDRLEYSVPALALSASGVRLAAPGRESQPFFAAARVRVDLARAALAGRLALDAVAVDDARVTIERAADGSLNLPRSGARRPGPAPEIRLASLTLRDVSFSYRDPGAGVAVEIPRLSAFLTGRGTRLEGPIAMAGFTRVRVGSRGVSVPDIRARLTWNGRDLALDRFTVEILPDLQASSAPAPRLPPSLAGPGVPARLSTASLAVRLDRVLDDPALDAEAEGTATLDALARWLGAPGTAAGDVAWTARSQGRLDSLVTRWRLAAPALVVSPAPPLALRASGTLDAARLALESIEATAAGGRIEGRGEWPFDGGAAGRLDLSWRNLPLEVLLGAFAVPAPVRLGGRLSGRAETAWIGPSLAAFSARLENRTEGVGDRAERAGGRGTLALAGRAAVRLADGRVSIEHAHELGGIRLAGTATGRYPPDRFPPPPDRLALAGGFHIEAGTLDEAIETWRAAGLPVPGAVPAIRGGRATVEGRLAGTLADLRLSAHIDAEAAGLADRRAGAALSADATLDRRRFSVVRGELRQGANRAGFEGEITFGSKALAARIDATLADPAPLWRAAALPAPWTPSGIVDVSATIGGTLARPRASARIEAASVSAAGLRDAAVSADLDATPARVTLRALEISHPAGRLAGQGHLDLGGPRSFSIDATVSVADAAMLQRQLAPGAPSVEGSLALRGRASGSMDAIEEVGLDVTIEHLEGRVAGLPVALVRPARLVALQTTATLDDLELRAGQSRLRAGGTLTPGGSGLSIEVDGRLEDLAPLAAALEVPAGLALSGPFTGRFLAAGHVTSPAITGRLSLPDTVVALPDAAPAAVAVDVRIEDGAVAADALRGAWQGATIDAQAYVPLRLLDRWVPEALLEPAGVATPPAWLRARFAGVTPAHVQRWMAAGALADVDGRLSGVVEARARRLAVDAVTGTLTLDEGRVRLGQVPLEQRRPTRLAIAGGRIRVEDWAWSGPGTDVTLAGGVTLGGEEVRLDAALDATLDLQVASVLIAPAAAAGEGTLSISLGGPLRSPLVDGRITVRRGELRVRDPRILVTDLTLDAQLARDRFVIDRLAGTLNGGSLTGAGRGRLAGASLAEVDIRLEGRGAAVEFPEGLQSEIDAELRLSRMDPAESPLLSGTVTVLRGIYREQLSLARQLFQPRRRTASAAGQPPAFLGALRLDVAVTTAEDIVVDNNVGRFEAGAALRLLGTLARPSLAGRIGLREGGAVFLGGTTYRLDRGAIDFLNPREIEPTIDITARTQIGEYDIRLQASGTPGQIQADLSSQPPLGRSDIVSLLATGRTVAQGGLTTEVVGEQVLGYLSGDLLGFAGRALGLDSVRLQRGDVTQDLRFDPTLVATQANPTQRLTVSKDVGRQVELVLSQNLKSGDLTWLATYRPRRGLAARVVSNDDGDRSYEFRQEVAVGGRAVRGDRTPSARLRVARVTFAGDARADRRELEGRLALREGRRFDFYRWTADRDRVLAFYHERGYYEARVSAMRQAVTSETGESAYELIYDVRRGPRTSLVVTGASLPRDVVRRMVEEWQRSVFTGFLVDDYVALVRTALAGEGWVRARVEVEVDAAAPVSDGAVPEKTIRVRITPGPRHPDRAVAWSGNQALASGQLDAALAARDLSGAVWVDPAPALEAVAALYRAEGYLQASASAGEPVFEDGRARLPIVVKEGRQFRVGNVVIDGVRAIDPAAARQALGLRGGDIYRPAMVDPALVRLEARYRQEGFNRVRAEVTERVRPEDALVDLDVRVDEGPRQILASVEVAGAAGTHPSVVDRALKLARGEPLDLASLYEARKRLYETGVFRQVDVETEPLGEPAPAAQPGVREERLRVKVALEEWPTWRLRFGFVLTDVEAPSGEGREVGPGVSADLERSNLFGRAATAGIALRQERRRNTQRAYFSLPRLLALPVTTTIFLGREFRTFTPAGAEALDTELVTLTGEQRFRVGGLAQVSYGYTYGRGRTKTILDVFGQPFPIELAVNYATLFSSVLIDRRDDPLNARRGWFHSTAFEYASTALGSDLRYVKVLAQQSYYRPVGPVVLASAGRLGLAEGFGQEVVRNERLFAGGSTSVRGFGEDALGPADTFGLPAGGDALVVLNQEVRFPLWRRFGGVAFVDAGNVFASPTAIDVGDLEVGAGVGLRVATPFGLLRVDYGVPVSRTPRFTSGRWYFSFGQAF